MQQRERRAFHHAEAAGASSKTVISGPQGSNPKRGVAI